MSPTMSAPVTIIFNPGASKLPDSAQSWVQSQNSAAMMIDSGDELMAIALRGRPRLVIFDVEAGRKLVDRVVPEHTAARFVRDGWILLYPDGRVERFAL